MSDGLRDGKVPVRDEDEEVDEAPTAPDEDAAGSEVDALREELAELRDRNARTLADFDNYRKRIERDRRDERRYGALSLASGVVGVVDNLERALEAGGSVDDLKAGVEMTLRQLKEALERHDIQRIEALGQPFDPNHHEAVSRHEEASVVEPTVSAELQSGYTLHDRLVRPAAVTVALPPSSPETGEDEGDPTA